MFRLGLPVCSGCPLLELDHVRKAIGLVEGVEQQAGEVDELGGNTDDVAHLLGL